MMPVWITEWQENLSEVIQRLPFSWRIRRALYRHLANQIRNKISIIDALESFRSRLVRRGRKRAEKIVADVIRRMKDGAKPVRALAAWIPDNEAAMISAGDASGDMPTALRLVIETNERISRIRKKLRAALLPPFFFMAALFAMIWVIGAYVTPSLEQSLPIQRTHGDVYALYVVSGFADSSWAFFPLFAVILLVGIVLWSLPRWTGEARIAAERFVPWSTYRDLEGYAWLMTFSALQRVDIPEVEILEGQLQNASPWLAERISAYKARMENGASLSQAILPDPSSGSQGFGFPNPDIADDIAALHGYPDFPELISEIAAQWVSELEETTIAMVTRFGHVIVFLITAVAIFMAFAINDMSGQLSSSLGIH